MLCLLSGKRRPHGGAVRVPTPVDAAMWLAGAVVLSWIAVAFLGAALALLAVEVLPVNKQRLWIAAAGCLLVACVVGLLTLIPASVLWDFVDKWNPVIEVLKRLPRD